MCLDIKRILESRKLPTMPAAAARLLQLFGAPDPDRKEIVDAINSDPGIAARVIKASNSSSFGLRSEVATIEHAVALLGPTTLASLCLTFSLSRFSLKGQPGEKCFRSVWEQSLLRASAAETIAAELGMSDPKILFMQALLSDLGQLAILAVDAPKYNEVFEHDDLAKLGMVRLEEDLLKVNHVNVGVELATRWELPQAFIRAIENHHESAEQLSAISGSEDMQQAAIVAMASLMAEVVQAGTLAARHGEIMEIGVVCLDLDSKTTARIIETVREQIDSLPSEFGLETTNVATAEVISNIASELLVSVCVNADAAHSFANANCNMLRDENESLREICQLLRVRANVDHVTQLFNRGFIDFYLNELISKHVVNGNSVGVICCEIDESDLECNEDDSEELSATLKEVSNRIVATVTDRDVVARYNDRGFVVVVWRKQDEEIEELARSIHLKVQEKPIVVPGSLVNVTLNVGLATTTNFQSGSGPKLVHSADQALREAKDNQARSVAMTDQADQENTGSNHAQNIVCHAPRKNEKTMHGIEPKIRQVRAAAAKLTRLLK